MDEITKLQVLEAEEHGTKSKKNSVSGSKKKSVDDDLEKSKEREKGEKRTKRRKASDSSKKLKKDEFVEGKNTSRRHSSATPDSEPRQDQSDSPITDDVFEGSNSSIESSEILSMSSLLKSVLDRKKKLLLESDEIQQFFKEHMVKQERWDGPSE